MIRLSPTALTVIGQPIGLGCQQCPLLKPCGGIYQGWNCLSQCCGKAEQCNTACFRSRKYMQTVRDAGGFDINQKWQIAQALSKLPKYIPHIGHGYGRSECSRTRNVALTTYDVLRLGSDCAPTRLREHFKISPESEVLLLSIAKDNRLEHYWKREVSQRLPERLATMGIQYVTAPNYSFPLNVPRPEHLLNRRRSLVSAERLSAVGIKVIPHLNAVTQTDWDCWRDFLKDHPHLYFVAMEFQTGLCQKFKAKWHLRQLLNLQEALGRQLHLIAVGGRRHISFLSELPSVTVVNAVPFMRTMKRRRFHRLANSWKPVESQPGEDLDDLWSHNCRTYSRAVIQEFRHYKRQNLRLLSTDDDGIAETPIENEAVNDSGQLEFWPIADLVPHAAPMLSL
jgi:hypothetical protein